MEIQASVSAVITASLQPRLNTSWAVSAPAMGMTKLITLSKMVDSQKILTLSLAEIKQFNEWFQAHQLNQMNTQEQWSLIAYCFPQDTLGVTETIVGWKRSGRLTAIGTPWPRPGRSPAILCGSIA